MATVFVSHASVDQKLAGALCSWLRNEGHIPFLDRDQDRGLSVGERWEERLYRELRAADAVVCLLTDAYRASHWCFAEIGIAKAVGSLLLPVRIDPQADHPLVPASQYQHADYTADPTAALAELGRRLRSLDARGGAGWADDRSPFPGLKPFDANQHRAFFGRRAEVRELTNRLRALSEATERGLWVVVGPSGCGKSSLIRAGLLPALTDDPGWVTLPALRPGTDPLAGLVRALAISAARVDLTWTAAFIRDQLDRPHGLARLAEELLIAGPGRARHRLLVALDQGEELLTTTPVAARATFAQLLRDAVAGSVHVVATLRSEYLDLLLAEPALTGLPVTSFPLRPLARELLPGVIEGPARLAGLRIDPELVSRLVADTGNGDALPLLAFTLHHLADGLSRGDSLSVARYEALGGVQGALAGRADAALAAASAATGRVREEVISGLLQLVTVDEQGHPIRRRVDQALLPQPVRRELDVFVAHRLLTTDLEDGAVWLDVAHEAVLSSWRPLAEAIQDAATALRTRQTVDQAAAEWIRSHQRDAYLWERDRILAAATLLGAQLPSGRKLRGPAIRGRLRPTDSPHIDARVELSPAAVAFLQAGMRRTEAAQRRARRRRLGAFTTLSVLLVLALAAAGLALTERNEAREQRDRALARELAARSNLLGDGQPDVGLLLGLESLRIDPTSEEARAALVAALTRPTHISTQLSGHTATVNGVDFSPDGRLLASGGSDGTVRVWDVVSDRPHGQVLPAGIGRIMAVTFSRDGSLLAWGGRGDKGVVRLWDVATRREHGGPLDAHTAAVNDVAFSPDGRLLASAGDDGKVQLWDVPTRREHGGPLDAHTAAVNDVAFSPDGRLLASAGDDGKVQLWDVASGRNYGHIFPERFTRAKALAFSPDAKLVAVGGRIGSQGEVLLYDLARHTTYREFAAHGQNVFGVSFSPDGRLLASAGRDGSARTWEVSTGALYGAPFRGHTGEIERVTFSPDGKRLATASSDRSVRIWDVATTRPLGAPLVRLTAFVNRVAVSPDGKLLASCGHDPAVRLWNLPEGSPHGGALIGDKSEVMDVVFSPDGKLLASAGTGGKVGLWDVTAGRPRAEPVQGRRDEAMTVAFSPDGRLLASGGTDGSVRLLDLSVRRPRGEAFRGPVAVYAIAFSPDGRVLASADSQGTVWLWDVVTGKLRRRIPATPRQALLDLAFSPDGELVAAAGEADGIALIDIAGGSRTATLRGHRNQVYDLAFSPDGRLLASASEDGTVRLWDISRGDRQSVALPTHTGAATSVAFILTREPSLVTGGEDRTIRLWRIGTSSWRALACRVANRDLSREEWRDLIGNRRPFEPTCGRSQT